MTLVKRNKTNSLKDKTVAGFSYHNQRSEVGDTTGRDPSRTLVSENRLRKFVNRTGLIVFIAVCLVSLISILKLSSKPEVMLIGNTSENGLFQPFAASLKNQSQKLLASSILNDNKITVNTNGITKTLEADYPEFSQISINIPFIENHPVIYLTQSSPALILENSFGQYLINNSGIALIKGTDGSFNSLGLPVIQDQSGLTITLGQPTLTSSYVSFIQTVVYQLSAKHYQISSMTLPASSSELDVGLAGISYQIKFNLENNSPKLQVGRFLAVENYFKQNNISPSSYVDVSVEGRAYYK